MRTPVRLGVELWAEPVEQPSDPGTAGVYDVDAPTLHAWQEARTTYLSARATLVGEIERQGWRAQPEAEHINVVFDRGPGPWPQQLIDVEDDQGRSVTAGEWIERDDGTWALRIHR